MSGITYENYPYTNGGRNDEKLNKRILSLARRHKFYLPQIKSVLGPPRHRYFGGRSYQICVAKKKMRKDYKVVGFIIYDFGNGCWGSKGEYCLVSLEYWLVDKKFRGQGIGKELYNQFYKNECCECSNFKVMFDSSQPDLVQLYLKLGFRYIDKYDGVETEKTPKGDTHIIWFKINYHTFKIGSNEVKVYEGENYWEDYESEVAD